MARGKTIRLTSLALANALLPVALLVFAVGFFPYKPLLPGLATFEDDRENGGWAGGRLEPVFDRVIFMVVDALRSDFVYGHNSGFHFTQKYEQDMIHGRESDTDVPCSLIRDGAAIPFTAHASPPTVTMPRIKALTTGSVPSFADLIFNLDESGSGANLATQDTWLAQIKAKGGKLVFFGDDTWLRLFPNDFFERADGTSSFFVSDFTEVDHNVTRHVPAELESDDWSAMIMHYLGLDHIGHKTGPQGPNMLPKQEEMDGIVKSIYEAMESQPHLAKSLLVLAGDHGMNAGGNHGGSGPGETEPALLFASPKFKERKNPTTYECPTSPKEGTEFHYYRKVQQSDIVPTLAGLLGMPISKNSLGVFIGELAEAWSDASRKAQIMYQNARQISKIVEAAYGADAYSTAVEKWSTCLRKDPSAGDCGIPDDQLSALAKRWSSTTLTMSGGSEARHGDMSQEAAAFLTVAQDILSSAASSYDVPRMVLGMLICGIALVMTLVSLPAVWPPSTAGSFFAITCFLYGIMMFASSYVEEEQHFWYWLTPAWVALLTAENVIRSRQRSEKLACFTSGLVILAVHRIAIRCNQTGQKHAGEPDIVHTFFPEHHLLMWLLILATYGYTCWMVAGRTFLDLVPGEVAALSAIVLAIPAVVFKLNFTHADAPELVQDLALQIRVWTAPFSLVSQAQVSFAVLLLAALTVSAMAVSLARGTELARKDGPAVNVTLAERLHHLLTLFLITQSRATNIPLFLGFALQSRALHQLLHSATHTDTEIVPRRSAAIPIPELATTALLLSHTYFFCEGGSNSISSVDLSNAYNGVGDYNVAAVGLLLFASNWNGPIWWCSVAVLMTFSRPSQAIDDSRTKTNGSRSWVNQERSKLRQDASATKPSSPSSAQDTNLWLWYVSCMTAFVAAGLLAVMTACTLLRTHLFIWTVFSPKYLYAMAWCIGWHLLVNIGFGGALRGLGSIA
ncbi:major facilitator super transporter protein [Recurvomyces mirabilis]|uniref:GPI ethanolamine phosphate transferase 2 n=1 Tax=Recurvomyces mirabilis TaxID=574656 RepID=A0AAE0WQU7_9PEZI|nr:major facilitator super transporter protein [Recurvomyces mirabilis]KAK5154712.1 major facilitator superfamily transporter protein [Recurvomyces mirabilis]